MKVTCDTCQTKYTIADEKVQGRAYRVRCKKCGTTFIVRGDEGAGENAASSDAPVTTSTVSADAVWHILIAGVQRGPMPPAEIASLLASGEATLEHYAWKEGLDGWKPLKEIPELSALDDAPTPALAPAPTPAAAAPLAIAAKLDDPFAVPKSGDLFAKPEPEPPEEEEPEEPSRPAAGGIFTPSSPAAGLFAKPAVPEPEEDGPTPIAKVAGGRAAGGADLFAGLGTVPEPTEPPPPVAGPGLTGARNENSVLFSLSALQGMSGPTAAKPDASSSGEGFFPSLEGLKPVVSTPGKKDALDDIINLGGASPFQASVGAPVLAPTEGGSESTGLVKALIAVAIILVAGIIVLIVLLLRPPPERVAREEEPGSAEPRSTQPETSAPASTAPATTAAGTTAPASAAAETTRSERTRDREGRETTREEPTSERQTKSNDPLEEMMRKVTKQEPREAPARTSAPAPSANATPDRSSVMAAMNGVSGAVRTCAGGVTGTANIRITFAGGSGHVTTAQVQGAPFAGTPAGSCMARAVRSATVPPFTNPTLSVTFPFVIR